MTIKELLAKRKSERLACVCPQCAAINDLCARITLAKRQPELAEFIPAWEDGITKLKAIKIKGIQAIMDNMPDIAKAEADKHQLPKEETE